MPKISLHARWVLPVDRPPISGGVVVISAGRIAAVGDRSIGDGPLQDLGDAALLPGLINAHTHLEFSQLEQPLGSPGTTLPDWIRLVIAHRQREKHNVNAACLAGWQESLYSGVTTVGDIATTSQLFDSICPMPNHVCFQEAIGFSAARIDSVFADVEQRVGNSRISGTERIIDKPHLTVGISPHAPYSVHPQLVERLVGFANQQQLPVAMHLAESPEELTLLTDSSGPFRRLLEDRSMWDATAIPSGTKPLDYLKILCQAPHAIVVHGNYLDSEEIVYLSSESDRMSVVYCPRTHAYFGHTRFPLEMFLSAGVRVALGTDSRASNPDLVLLKEMRYLASQFSKVSPEAILRMGTLAGAEALGVDDLVGSITPGKWADLTAVPCRGSDTDPLEAILCGAELPTKTWLRGQLIANSNS